MQKYGSSFIIRLATASDQQCENTNVSSSFVMVPPFVPVFEVNCWKVKLTQMWIKARVEVFRQIFFPDFCLDLELRGNEVATRRQSGKNPLIASFDVHLINHQWFNEYTEKEILRKHIAPASLSRKKRNGSFGQFLYGGGGWMTQTHSICII